MSPEPPAAEIAQVQSYNTHLAKQAFVNLAKLSGKSATTPEDALQVEKRAARPQGVPADKAVEDILPKFLHLAADPDSGKEEEQMPNPAFPYGSATIRGVNLGGWLVREYLTLCFNVHKVILYRCSRALDHAFHLLERW